MKTCSQMVEQLKAMGLPHSQRAKCMETFRDVGEGEALEQAERYLSNNRNQIQNAKNVALIMCGLNI